MTTTPAEVTTKLGLQPRNFVVVKTFGVTCSIIDMRRDAPYWVAVRPPSIPRIWPVTNDAASEHRKMAGPVRSRVSPTRPIGMRLTIPALKSGSANMDATWGVSTKVGMIALTRIPWGAHSVAHWRVRELIAPLAATYAE